LDLSVLLVTAALLGSFALQPSPAEASIWRLIAKAARGAPTPTPKAKLTPTPRPTPEPTSTPKAKAAPESQAPPLKDVKVVAPDPRYRVPGSKNLHVPDGNYQRRWTKQDVPDPERGGGGSYRPQYLRERLAAEKIQTHPTSVPGTRDTGLRMGNPARSADEGWKKMEWTVPPSSTRHPPRPDELPIPVRSSLPGPQKAGKPMTFHYDYNKITGQIDDIKLKGRSGAQLKDAKQPRPSPPKAEDLNFSKPPAAGAKPTAGAGSPPAPKPTASTPAPNDAGG
jgi:hypothetical protein